MKLKHSEPRIVTERVEFNSHVLRVRRFFGESNIDLERPRDGYRCRYGVLQTLQNSLTVAEWLMSKVGRYSL